VEKGLADFFERELNVHIKMEMLKHQLHKCADWNTRAAFNLLDSQRQGFINHFNLYGFLNQNSYDASDEELIAVIRRIEGQGNGTVEYEEFVQGFDPIILRMRDIQLAEDEYEGLARNKRADEAKTRPFLQKLAQTKPISEKNSVDMNLQLYDQYKQLERGELPRGGTQGSPGAGDGTELDGGPGTEVKGGASRAYAQGVAAQTTPLRKNGLQHSVYKERQSAGNHIDMDLLDEAASRGTQSPHANPFPRGPPMTEMTNVHPGSIIVQGGQKVHVGPLRAEDERELVQVLYEMILNEKELEEAKQKLAEQGDFNMMDAFQMLDEKNLGWVSAP